MDVLQLNTSTGRVQQVALTSLPASSIETEVWNNSGATILKGSVVYINGAHGNLPTIALSQANTELTSSKTYGFVETDIGDNDNGFVIAAGLISNLDTFGVTEGVTLWLSPTIAGGYTTTKPTAPNHAVSLGTCTRAHPTLGTITVRVQNGYEIEELHNVSINGSLANGDLLQYESSTLLWKNVTTSFVLSVVLTGLSLATSTAIVATDTILVAFGKLQGQLNLFTALVTPQSTNTANSTGSSTAHARADHVHDTVIQKYNTSAITAVTTSSTSYVALSTMSVTVAIAGTYMIVYTVSTSGKGGDTGSTALYNNGSLVTTSESTVVWSINDQRMTHAYVGFIAVTDATNVDVRWKTSNSGNAATARTRSLALIRVSA